MPEPERNNQRVEANSHIKNTLLTHSYPEILTISHLDLAMRFLKTTLELIINSKVFEEGLWMRLL